MRSIYIEEENDYLLQVSISNICIIGVKTLILDTRHVRTLRIASKHFNIKNLLNETQCNCDVLNLLLQKFGVLNESNDVKSMLHMRAPGGGVLQKGGLLWVEEIGGEESR